MVHTPHLVKRELYGGALTMDIPADMIDASTFRQIPDTQEVYVGKENPDYSVIVDLLECVPASNLNDALDEHMQEITRLNGASLSSTKVLVQRDTAVPPSSSTQVTPVFAGIRVFEQRVPKFGKQSDVEDVVVAIGLLRLPSPASTDVLVTVNVHVTSKDTSVHFLAELAGELVRSLSVCDLALFG